MKKLKIAALSVIACIASFQSAASATKVIEKNGVMYSYPSGLGVNGDFGVVSESEALFTSPEINEKMNSLNSSKKDVLNDLKMKEVDLNFACTSECHLFSVLSADDYSENFKIVHEAPVELEHAEDASYLEMMSVSMVPNATTGQWEYYFRKKMKEYLTPEQVIHYLKIIQDKLLSSLYDNRDFFQLRSLWDN